MKDVASIFVDQIRKAHSENLLDRSDLLEIARMIIPFAQDTETLDGQILIYTGLMENEDGDIVEFECTDEDEGTEEV